MHKDVTNNDIFEVNSFLRGFGHIPDWLMITKYNGMTIRSIKDIPKAQKLNPESKFDIIEFENDNATVVLRRDQLAQSDAVIAERYGIVELIYLD